MKVTTAVPASGVTGASGGSTVDQAMDDLEQMLQQIQMAQQNGTGANINPDQLANGITNALNKLKTPQETGQLSPDQDTRLNAAMQTISNMMQGNGAQNQSQPQQTGFPTDDQYTGKVGGAGGHHKGGHVHAAPPVTDPDADSNAIPTDSDS